jgi:hypothetical protein
MSPQVPACMRELIAPDGGAYNCTRPPGHVGWHQFWLGEEAVTALSVLSEAATRAVNARPEHVPEHDAE